jgi:hypothetical protein
MSSSIVSPLAQWEYQCLTRGSEGPLLEALNEAGREGWELVNAGHHRDDQGTVAWVAILKRPLGPGPAVVVSGQRAATPAQAMPTEATPAESGNEGDDFDFGAAGAPAAKPVSRPRSPRPAPVKPRMELSDDFDFELAGTIPGAPQPTKQSKAKAKPAAEEDEFDFEFGESSPAPLQAAKPQPPKPESESDDDTGFDLG